MPTLFDTFRDYAQDQLEMIAEHWGIEEEIDWRNNPVDQLAGYLSDKSLFTEILGSLPESSKNAFRDLVNANGRISRAHFSRSHGDIRDMGAGIRAKERPDRNPASDTERLYYLGFIGIAFFDIDQDPKEFFYLPDEFQKFTTPGANTANQPDLSTVPENKLTLSIQDGGCQF